MIYQFNQYKLICTVNTDLCKVYRYEDLSVMITLTESTECEGVDGPFQYKASLLFLQPNVKVSTEWYTDSISALMNLDDRLSMLQTALEKL